MPNYLRDAANLLFGGGDLLVNTIDQTYSDSDLSKFTSLGATDRESGGSLKVEERVMQHRYNEVDRDEPFASWVEGQVITFEITLLEATLENFILSIGGNLAAVITVGNEKRYGTYLLRVPSRFPFIFIAREGDASTYTKLIMPSCEAVGAQELSFRDGDIRKLKLSLKLHRATAGALVGCKFEIRQGAPGVS